MGELYYSVHEDHQFREVVGSTLPACCGGKWRTWPLPAPINTLPLPTTCPLEANGMAYEWVNGESVTYRSDSVSQFFVGGLCIVLFEGAWTPIVCRSVRSAVFEYDCEDA